MHVLTTLHPLAHREDKDVHLHELAVYPPSTLLTSSVLNYWLLEPLIPVPVINTHDTYSQAPSGALQ